MLDYDGTLVPIAARPEFARLSSSRRRVLARLAGTPGVAVAIITGRSLSDITKLVSVPGLVFAACHGLEMRIGRRTYFPCGKGLMRPLASLARELKGALCDIPGVLVEAKGFAVAIHYRMAPRRRWPEVERVVRRASLSYRKRFDLQVTSGKRVWEVRPALRRNKGDAALWILRRCAPGACPIFIGDDATDEDAFRAIRGRGTSIAVGRGRRGAADYRISDVRGVWRLIRLLAPPPRAIKKGGRDEC